MTTGKEKVSHNIRYLEFCLDPGSSDCAVVLFHGYGANCQDLAPLRECLNAPVNTTWVFPDGVLEVLIGPMWTGRAWFQIDVNALEEAMRRGEHRDLSVIRPEGMDHAVTAALKFWQDIRSQFNKVILGGFSQGAMLATEVALKSDKPPDALVVLSGALVSQAQWQDLKPSKTFPVFQSHGQSDPLLSFKGAKNLKDFLQHKGLEVEFHEFTGGHEIPPTVLQKLAQFLKPKWSS